MAIKACCTWGEGEDVLIEITPEPGEIDKAHNSNEDPGLMLYKAPDRLNKATYGYCNQGSLYLTANEAKQLANQLIASALECERLEADLQDYMQNQRDQK